MFFYGCLTVSSVCRETFQRDSLTAARFFSYFRPREKAGKKDGEQSAYGPREANNILEDSGSAPPPRPPPWGKLKVFR